MSVAVQTTTGTLRRVKKKCEKVSQKNVKVSPFYFGIRCYNTDDDDEKKSILEHFFKDPLVILMIFDARPASGT